MPLTLQITPHSKQNQVIQLDTTLFHVKTTAPAIDNQANLAVIKLLSKHLKVKKSQLIIISGEKSHTKIVQVLK